LGRKDRQLTKCLQSRVVVERKILRDLAQK